MNTKLPKLFSFNGFAILGHLRASRQGLFIGQLNTCIKTMVCLLALLSLFSFRSVSQTVTPVKYGYLYNGYAATDIKQITSHDDWRVPTQSDFDVLIAYLGGSLQAGGKLKEAGFVNWLHPNTGEIGRAHV